MQNPDTKAPEMGWGAPDEAEGKQGPRHLCWMTNKPNCVTRGNFGKTLEKNSIFSKGSPNQMISLLDHLRLVLRKYEVSNCRQQLPVQPWNILILNIYHVFETSYFGKNVGNDQPFLYY